MANPVVSNACGTRAQTSCASNTPERATWCSDVLPTVAERVAALFLSEDLGDVVFLVGEEELRFPANKLILAIGSPVFRDMFFANTKNSCNGNSSGGSAAAADNAIARCTNTSAKSAKLYKEGNGNEVKLPDTDPDAFEMVLSYLYTDQLMLSNVWQISEILCVAEKYMLPIEIFDICKEYLICNMNTDNFYEVYKITTSFYLGRKGGGCLVKKCWNFLLDYGNDFLQHKAFQKLDTEVLTFILSRDALCVSSEIVVFNALTNWAAQNCIRQKKEATPENKREVLGNLIQLIRFLNMTWMEFLEGPAKSGILTPDEVKKISTDIACGSDYSLPPGCVQEPRVCTEYEITFTLSRMITQASKQCLETLLLLSTQDIILTQIRFLPELDEDMQVAIISLQDECLFFTGCGRCVEVPFVYLRADNIYKIQSYPTVGKMNVGMPTKNVINDETANGRRLRVIVKAFIGRNVTWDEACQDPEWVALKGKAYDEMLLDNCIELTTVIQSIKFLV